MDRGRESDFYSVFRRRSDSLLGLLTNSALFAGFLAAANGAFLYFFLPYGGIRDKFWIAITLGCTAFAVTMVAFYVFRRSETIKYSSLEVALEDIKVHEITFENFRELEKQKDRIEFQKNLAQPLTLLEIESDGFDMFQGLDWSIQPNINILLGRNGYGKTRLLQSVVALLAKDATKSEEIFKNCGPDNFLRITMSRLNDETNTSTEVIERNKKSFAASVGKVPALALPDSRFINKSRTDIGPVNDDYKDILEYGCHHFLYQKPYEPVIQTFLYQACVDYLASRRITRRGFDIPALQLIRNTIRALTDQSFEFSRIEPTGQQATFAMDVITEGDISHPIPIQHVSQGTQSVLSIFGLIFSFLKRLRPDVSDQQASQHAAVVIIDEIDAHLHPIWQQRIVGLLRETFPRTQFILTAHSPLVVAGCREQEVTVLRRQDSKFTLVQFSEDFIGWQPDAIYRKVFGVEELDETYKFFSALSPERQRFEDRLNQLERKSIRTPSEERELSGLHEKIRYIDKSGEAQTRRVQSWDLENQNSYLRQENAALKRDLESLREQTSLAAKLPGV